MSTTQDARKKFTMGAAQENLYAVNLANVIADVNTDKMGTVYNPYTSRPVAINGLASATTSYTPNAYVNDADSLQINRRAAASEHIDSYDWKSAEINLLQDRGMNMGQTISQVIDGYVLSLPVTTSGISIIGDGGVVGTTSVTPWTTSNTNIDDVLLAADQELNLANSGSKRFMVVSSYEATDLKSYLMGTGNNVADEVIRNGIVSQVSKIGVTATGVDVFQSNNITQEVNITLATNPTAGDTITIGKEVITFVAALTGAASEIHITGSAAATAANLAEWINARGQASEVEGTNTGYSAASTEGQSLLTRVQASATVASTTVTLRTLGVIKLSDTLTAAGEGVQTAYRFLVFGDYGSINLYLPSAGMDYVEKEVGGKPGVEVYMEQFYNAVIWTRMKDRVLAVKVN